MFHGSASNFAGTPEVDIAQRTIKNSNAMIIRGPRRLDKPEFSFRFLRNGLPGLKMGYLVVL
jgi:hypothetical protein